MALAWLLLLQAAVLAVASSDEPRLVEQIITLQTVSQLGVPIVDPPKRISGYFKLDRTKDAQMFYFLVSFLPQMPCGGNLLLTLHLPLGFDAVPIPQQPIH